MIKRIMGLSALVLLSVGGQAIAEDYYATGSIADLLKMEGDEPALSFQGYRRENRWLYGQLRPRIQLDGEGEIYLTSNVNRGQRTPAQLAIRLPKRQAIAGTLYWPDQSYSRLKKYRFRVIASQLKPDERHAFLVGKRAYYMNLLREDRPGAAWFRHQMDALTAEIGDQSQFRPNRRFLGRSVNQLEDSFALVSGGRALSENLQLDRVLPEASDLTSTVEIASIEGITVKEFDWAPYIKDVQPRRDPSIDLIPFDQHVLLFPSFEAMARVIDHAKDNGIPVLNAMEPRSEDARTQERYEQQLGISLNAAARLFGPALIRSIAMTGSDPYLRSGSDLALLFEARSTEALEAVLMTQIQSASQSVASRQTVTGNLSGVAYKGFSTPDRQVSSYVATLGPCVVVTNSLVQLQRLIAVSKGELQSLGQLDEYAFFRDRYPLGESQESGLLLLSDATIRRWCGPRWRIATSRRSRAMAAMLELQARHVDQLLSGETLSKVVYDASYARLLGPTRFGKSGIQSDVYGTLDFMTPIVEMELEKVSNEEARLYRRWRDGYQSAWSNFFDPIAVQLQIEDGKLVTDVTVMPLITSSRYNAWIRVSQGATLKPEQADLHPSAAIQFAMALNSESEQVKSYANLLTGFTSMRISPLSWIGDTISIYVDKSPFWDEMAKAEDREEFIESNFMRVPIAVNIASRSSFRLTAFLAGLRAYIDQAAPGMTQWETLEYKELSYVKVSPSARAMAENPQDEFKDAAIYYAVAGDAWVVSLSEQVLKESLDRRLARIAEREARKSEPEGGRAHEETLGNQGLPGGNLLLQVDRSVIEFVQQFFSDDYHNHMRSLSLRNLDILNEWKRLYPDRDPNEVHQQVFQTRLVCPGGKGYDWNEEWQTMESRAYGHWGELKSGPRFPAAIRELDGGAFGITFEPDGLRARVELRRSPTASNRGKAQRP